MAKAAVKTRAKSAKPVANVTGIGRARPVDLVMELMAIPGTSGNEDRGRQLHHRRSSRAAGVPASAIRHDNAHKKTPLAGEVGNLIVQLPGTIKAPRRLLMAHMDTVPICVGSKPVRAGRLRSLRRSEDRAGRRRSGGRGRGAYARRWRFLSRELPHPPLTFLWAIQEEVGLHGARCRANVAAGQADAGVQLGRRRGRKAHDRRDRRLPDADRHHGLAAMPAERRNRGSARSPSLRWRSPSWCAKAGTG